MATKKLTTPPVGHGHRRVCVYVAEKAYMQLRMKLLGDGVSVSEWVRRKIEEAVR